MINYDLPAGYRWATAEETEHWEQIPDIIVIQRTTDSDGRPYAHGEADLAVPCSSFVTPPTDETDGS